MEKYRDMTIADFYNGFETKEKSELRYKDACKDLEILNELLHKRNPDRSLVMRYYQGNDLYKFCLTVKEKCYTFVSEYIFLNEQYIWEFTSAIGAIKETLSIFEVY